MARGSGVTIRLYSRRLPLLPGALEFAEMGIIPAGAYRNLDYVKPRLTVAESVQQARVDLISDPQTSGGIAGGPPYGGSRGLARGSAGARPGQRHHRCGGRPNGAYP